MPPWRPLLAMISAHNVSCVCCHKQHEISEDAKQDDVRLQLFEQAPCDVFLVRTAGQVPRLQKFLVPMAGGPHARRALVWATDLANAHDGSVTALHIQRHVLAEQAGRSDLEKAVASAGVAEHARLELRVQHDAKVSRGISTVAEEHDVVLLGASDRMALSRALFGTIADHVLARQRGSVTVAVFSASRPDACAHAGPGRALADQLGAATTARRTRGLGGPADRGIGGPL